MSEAAIAQEPLKQLGEEIANMSERQKVIYVALFDKTLEIP